MTPARVKAFLVMVLAALASAPALSQTATDIYLLDLAALEDGRTVILRITDVPGYDNQPHFSAD
ncbi:MAG: hypothetical protein AAGI67_21190, partial [Pseudomonadota bacterium]